MAERFQAQQEAIATLTIEHQDPTLIVRDAHDREETLYTDERVFDRTSPRGQTYEASGQWKRDTLRFETVQSNYGPGSGGGDLEDDRDTSQTESGSWVGRGRGRDRRGGGQATETWGLSDDGQQLTIVTKTQRGGQGRGGRSLELKRVYDLVAPNVDSEDSNSDLSGTSVSKGTEVPVLEAPEEGGETSSAP